MSERLAFIQACLNRREHLTSICARFHISEKTGHKWLARFREGGEAALMDRSHTPVHAAHAMDRAIATQLVALRTKHPLYGPAKLRDLLVHGAPATRWPAVSTIGALLKREGLVRPRRRRPATHGRLESGRTDASGANVVWTADFKGHFRVGTGEYCYPLTVLDLHHHYLLGCIAQPTTAVALTRRGFARLFAAYGLPEVIRSDNGVPFAQPNALGRLGALAYWWVRLGIRPEHTRPATPSENGAHERFHTTLKAHTAQPAARSLVAQQRHFDRFAREYNTVRPHDSTVDHRPPGHAYVPSPRPYPRKLPPLQYARTDEIRRVDPAGAIQWRNQSIFLSSNLSGEYVALSETAQAVIQIRYARLILGTFDPATKRFTGEVTWNDDGP